MKRIAHQLVLFCTLGFTLFSCSLLCSSCQSDKEAITQLVVDFYREMSTGNEENAINQYTAGVLQNFLTGVKQLSENSADRIVSPKAFKALKVEQIKFYPTNKSIAFVLANQGNTKMAIVVAKNDLANEDWKIYYMEPATDLSRVNDITEEQLQEWGIFNLDDILEE